MRENEAKFLFLVYVSLQRQIAEAAGSEKAALIAHRQSTLRMLHEADYQVVFSVPYTPNTEVEGKLILLKAGDDIPIAEENITIRLSPEQLQKIQDAERTPTSSLPPKDVLLHFLRFVNVFRRNAEEGIGSYVEKTAATEAHEQALQELKLLGWEINMHYMLNYDAASAQEGVPATFTFLLFPLGRRSGKPAAEEEVTLFLSEEEVLHLLGKHDAPPDDDAETDHE